MWRAGRTVCFRKRNILVKALPAELCMLKYHPELCSLLTILFQMGHLYGLLSKRLKCCDLHFLKILSDTMWRTYLRVLQHQEAWPSKVYSLPANHIPSAHGTGIPSPLPGLELASSLCPCPQGQATHLRAMGWPGSGCLWSLEVVCPQHVWEAPSTVGWSPDWKKWGWAVGPGPGR